MNFKAIMRRAALCTLADEVERLAALVEDELQDGVVTVWAEEVCGQLRTGAMLAGAVDVTTCADEGRWFAWMPGMGWALPSPETLVRYRTRGAPEGVPAVRTVGSLDWGVCGLGTITAYQIADDGHSAGPAPKVTESGKAWKSSLDAMPITGTEIEVRGLQGDVFRTIYNKGDDLCSAALWRYAD